MDTPRRDGTHPAATRTPNHPPIAPHPVWFYTGRSHLRWAECKVTLCGMTGISGIDPAHIERARLYRDSGRTCDICETVATYLNVHVP
jgi:hypothetical protein